MKCTCLCKQCNHESQRNLFHVSEINCNIVIDLFRRTWPQKWMTWPSCSIFVDVGDLVSGPLYQSTCQASFDGTIKATKVCRLAFFLLPKCVRHVQYWTESFGLLFAAAQAIVKADLDIWQELWGMDVSELAKVQFYSIIGKKKLWGIEVNCISRIKTVLSFLSTFLHHIVHSTKIQITSALGRIETCSKNRLQKQLQNSWKVGILLEYIVYILLTHSC